MKQPAGLALAVLLAAAASAQNRPPPRGLGGYADPSTVIAAEIAFAQLAQDKGQWSAFAATAAPDAVMFVPQMVYAQQWLKGRTNPPVAVKWQTHAVSSSCDGSLMVSHGAWQGPRGTGYFTTIWQRQKDGRYKWILDGGDSLNEPLAAPEMISGRIADCPPPGGRASRPPAPRSSRLASLDPARRSGQSDDGTLRWTVTVTPQGARNLSVDWKKDGAETPLLIEQVGAPAR